AQERKRLQVVRVVRDADDVEDERAERAEDRAGDCEARLAPRVVRHLLHRDQRTHERDEHRHRDRQPLPPRLEHVPHLVDEEQSDEAEREPPRPEQQVRPERDDHREEELELQEDGAELREEGADRGDWGPEPPCEAAPIDAFRLYRLVLAPLLGVLLHLSHCAYGYRFSTARPRGRIRIWTPACDTNAR